MHLSMVCGAVCDTMVYALPMPLEFNHYNIAHLEELHIAVDCKIWAYYCKNKRITIQPDNLRVIQAFSSGKARDPILATCVRNFFWIIALFSIQLWVVHVDCKSNDLADLLSRLKNSHEDYYKLNSILSNPIWITIHTFN